MYFFVNATFISLFLTICLNFFAFRKQFESIVTKLNVEVEKEERADPAAIRQRMNELIEHHTFIKEYDEREFSEEQNLI